MTKNKLYMITLVRFLLGVTFSLGITQVGLSQAPYFTEDNSNTLGAVSYYISTSQGQSVWEPFPVLHLDGSDSLTLDFDLIENGERSLFYRMVKYEYNWEPSPLISTEYLEGLNESDINMPTSSVATLTHYFHYHISFSSQMPNLHIKSSGNYLLQVYDKDDPSTILLTFPLAISENKIKIIPQRNIDVVNKRQQAIDIQLILNTLSINNPQRDIKVVVLQNGRWDNNKTLSIPSTISNNTISYINRHGAIFEGGNQYQKIEHTANQTIGIGMDSIYFKHNIYQVIASTIDNKAQLPYTKEYDHYGHQVIRMNNLSPSQSQDRADYQRVHFSFRSDQLSNGRIILVGEAFRYLPTEKKKLVYNTPQHEYRQSVLLKMGYQEYKYLFQPNNSISLLSYPTIGNHYQTTNLYTIIVYLKQIDDRSDRIIGYSNLSI